MDPFGPLARPLSPQFARQRARVIRTTSYPQGVGVAQDETRRGPWLS
jgi:hypothetical protein